AARPGAAIQLERFVGDHPDSARTLRNMSGANEHERLSNESEAKKIADKEKKTMTTAKNTANGSGPILAGKRAVVFGASGSIGAAVAKELAKEGAEVFLAGRTKSSLDEIVKQ